MTQKSDLNLIQNPSKTNEKWLKNDWKMTQKWHETDPISIQFSNLNSHEMERENWLGHDLEWNWKWLDLIGTLSCCVAFILHIFVSVFHFPIGCYSCHDPNTHSQPASLSNGVHHHSLTFPPEALSLFFSLLRPFDLRMSSASDAPDAADTHRHHSLN